MNHVPEIKNILFATDLTPNSLYAFAYAVQFALRFDALLTVLHVLEPAAGTFGLQVKKMTEEQEHESAMQEAREGWGRFTQGVDNYTDIARHISDILVRIGRPVEEILRAGEEEHCDIFVLAAHGKELLKHALLGSVSHEVLDRASKPVIIIPIPDKTIWDRP